MLSSKSLAEKGTLSQLKNSFGHKGVKHDIMNSFNSSDDFHRFITESHVVLYVMEKCSISTYDGAPNDNTPGSKAKDNKEDKSNYLHKIAAQLVDDIWQMPSQSEIQKVIEADIQGDTTEWCCCGMGKFIHYGGVAVLL